MTQNAFTNKRACVSACVYMYDCMSDVCAGEKIYPLVWEVVESLELFDIAVVSLTSDGAKPNRRFYSLCRMKEDNSQVPYKTSNPYHKDTQFYFFCDAPHLLKTSRNCFSNSHAHSKSRNLKVCKCSMCMGF